MPLEIVEVADAAIVCRGIVEFGVGGERARDLVAAAIAAFGRQALSIDEFVAELPAPDRPAARELAGQLIARRFLVAHDGPPAAGESAADVFDWYFERAPGDMARRLHGPFAVAGINDIGRRVAANLREAGASDVRRWDVAELRSGRPAPAEDGVVALGSEPAERDAALADLGPRGTLVVTADSAARAAFRGWNAHAFRAGRRFFPVVLDGLSGFIGPLTIAGATACYECLCSRENGSGSVAPHRLAMDAAAAAGGLSAVSGYPPAAAAALAAIAAFELIKLESGIPRSGPGSQIEVNLLTTRLVAHRVLRIPRCGVCSALERRSATNAELPLGLDEP